MDSELKGLLVIVFLCVLVFVSFCLIALGGKEYKLHCYREAKALGIEDARRVHELCD